MKDLVDLETLGLQNLRLDVVYATAENFVGQAVYSQARAILLKPVAEEICVVAKSLEEEKRLGLIVYDGYRPASVTRIFWDLTPEHLREFVANPAEGYSKHNRGCAVDLGLYDLDTGAVLEMPCAFDCFDERAHNDYTGGSELARQNRDLLREYMERSGLFSVQHNEWWHFNFIGWEKYPVLDCPFEDIP